MGLKWLKYVFIGVATLAMMLSCCNCKELANTTSTVVKDSVNIKTELRWRDTIAYAPADIARIMGMVICPDNGVINLPEVKQKSKQATVFVSIKNNKLLARCECDSLEIKMKLYEKQISFYKQHIDKTKAIKTVEVKYIPKWIKILAWIGALSIVLAIIILVIKIYKFFI